MSDRQYGRDKFSPPCPYCKSAKSLEYDTVEISHEEAYQKCSCGECGSEWNEVYEAAFIESITVMVPHPDAPKEDDNASE